MNVDTSDLQRLEQALNNFDEQKRSLMLYKSLMRAGQSLKQKTESSLTQKMGYRAVYSNIKGRGGKVYKPLITGVRIKGDKPYCEVMVHILGHGYLRWFELGTAIRTTKKGANRGSITALNFFFAAKQAAMGNVDTIVSQSLTQQINKELKL